MESIYVIVFITCFVYLIFDSFKNINIKQIANVFCQLIKFFFLYKRILMQLLSLQVDEMILNLDIRSNQMIPKFLLVIPKTIFHLSNFYCFKQIKILYKMLFKFFLTTILRTNCGQILLYLTRQITQNPARNQLQHKKLVLYQLFAVFWEHKVAGSKSIRLFNKVILLSHPISYLIKI